MTGGPHIPDREALAIIAIVPAGERKSIVLAVPEHNEDSPPDYLTGIMKLDAQHLKRLYWAE